MECGIGAAEYSIKQRQRQLSRSPKVGKAQNVGCTVDCQVSLGTLEVIEETVLEDIDFVEINTAYLFDSVVSDVTRLAN